jgi:hypothetical protein
MNALLTVISILFIVAGISIIAKANRVGTAIAGFCRSYPLVRHAGERQFVVKRVYVIILGLVFVAIGVVAFASLVL